MTKTMLVLRSAFLAGLVLAGTAAAPAQDWKAIVSGVVGAVAKGQDASEESFLTGTWNYIGPDCKFQSDNLLAKAGGEVAARKVEEQMSGVLSKLGFTEGCVYTFNADSTYVSTVKGRSTKGTFTYDSGTKELHLKTKIGLKFTAVVARSLAGNKISLLFNADKLMSLAQSVGGAIGGKSSGSALSGAVGLLEKYDGLQLGFELQKQ